MRRDGPMEQLVKRVLEDRRTHERGWFDVNRARRFFQEHRSGSRDRTEILWPNGKRQVLEKVPAGKLHVIEYAPTE